MTPHVRKTRPSLAELYETDETAWLEESARLIRDGELHELDYVHLGEYLFNMAQRDRRELRSRLKLLLVHRLKWQSQPGHRSRSWKAVIVSHRHDLASLLESPTLRAAADELLADVYSIAVMLAAADTGLEESSYQAACPYTADQPLTEELA